MPAGGQADFEGTQRFEVLRRLGEGGMGVVYEALDRERGVRVALKTVRDLDQGALRRLRREFRTLLELRHPNLVRLHELFEEEGRWFFTMELVQGTSFIDYVQAGAFGFGRSATAAADPGPAAAFDETRLRGALGQLARGLAAVHDAGKVHRDIKPSNVLVTAEGRVVLLDFGLAVGAAWNEQSLGEEPVGTVAYMAPEQAALEPVGPAADWYSVGVVLYEALTGRLPFVGSPLEIMIQKQEIEPPPPRTRSPAAPEDLDALCLDLLRREPRARPTAAQILGYLRVAEPAEGESAASSGGLLKQAPFVGREPELRVLGEAFERARGGQAVMVLVEGESGVGKSELARRFTAPLAERGAVVLTGSCYGVETVTFTALDGVVDALSQYLGGLPEGHAGALLPRRVALLGEAFPVLCRVRAVARAPRAGSEGRLDPHERRTRLFAAVRELFGRLAEQRPVVVVIDDLQWADADSLALLGEMLRPPDAPALLVIGTIRTGTGRTTAAVLEAMCSVPADLRRVSLGRLPPEVARELLAQLLALADTTALDAEQIVTEGAGHPLFIDEIVRHVATHGRQAADSLRLDDALLVRAQGLSPPARRILELVAVACRPFTRAVVGRAAGLEPREFATHLEALRAASFVQVTGARGADTVAPYHDRIREAIAADLAPDVRRAHELELALALEALGPADPEVLVVHWRGAGEHERAADYAARAAARAEASFAFDRAAQLYRAALDLRPPGHGSVRELSVKLGGALGKAGRGAEAAETYLRAAAGRADLDALDLRRRAAMEYMKCGRLDEGLAAIRALSAATGVRLARTPRGALVSLALRRALIRVRGYRFRVRGPDEVAEEQLRLIDFCGWVATALGIADWVRGNAVNARAVLMALKAGEPVRLARVLGMEAVFVSMSGTRARPRTEKLLAALHRVAHEVDDPEARAWQAGARGGTAYYAARFREAEEQLREADRILREEGVGFGWELGTMRLFSLFSLAYLGRVADLSRRAPQLVAEALDRGDLYAATHLRLSLPNLAWLIGGDAEEARRVAREALRSWSAAGSVAHDWFGPTAEVQIDLYRGAGTAARARMTHAWRTLKRSLLLHVQLVRIEALNLRARATLAAAVESAAERAPLLREAERDARRIQREDYPIAAPLGTLVLAAVAAARGDRATAVAHCRTAASGFEATEMALHAAVARRRHGELIGGDEGRALVAAADAHIAGERIKDPHRWAAMLAPGFPE